MTHTVSPRQLAQAIGVSESSLKRWADDGLLHVHRTAGGHRRIPLPEAVRFIRTMGAKIVSPSEIGLLDVQLPAIDWADQLRVETVFHEVLEQGDALRARSVIQGAYLAGWSVPRIVDGPLRASMMKIGDLWLHADWGIVVEHRATDICLQALNLLRGLLPATAGTGPTALVAALGHDPYMLPALGIAVSLSELGFTDVNLGPMTPASTLCNAINHYRPRLVCVSCSHATDQKVVISEVLMVRDVCVSTNSTLLIGGSVFAAIAPKQLPGVQMASSLTELAGFARGLLAAGN